MSPIDGVLSRQVLPACGSICYFCPSLRARSRQPVKRYKKLLADIFPRSQDEGPNDRKIGKLCEYASRNPLRIPKIVESLEQRCYKEIRNGNFHSAKIVICIYKKLVVSCTDQMPLFASSLLTVLNTLLDQTRQDDIQILGCQTLFEFVNNQKDSTHMFSLEGFIPKLCQLAQEIGDDERALNLRAAGLQALSSMIWFMGENSHISAEFDNVVLVVLENYGWSEKNSEKSDGQNRWVEEVRKNDSQDPPPSGLAKFPSWRTLVNDKGEPIVAAEDAKNPGFWSRVCLHNMATLAKEATTIRRVVESLFRFFDNGNLWSLQNGLAFSVLKDMQLLMDGSGQNTHFLLLMLVKHLDHKNVLKQPEMQIDIVEVIYCLTQYAKVESSVSIVGAISDILRHLRKSIHCSLDEANLGADVIKRSRDFNEAVDNCLVQLSYKVGDAGPILDVMAGMLENMSTVMVIARTTICVVYRAAQIVASLPNPSYRNKAFPEALFHQLLPAMVHPDHETRIGAHRIFSVVLVPSSVCPRQSSGISDSKKTKIPRSLSRAVSVFSSSAALFEKLREEKSSFRENSDQDIKVTSVSEVEAENNGSGILDRLKSSYSREYSSRNLPQPSTSDEDSTISLPKEPAQEVNSLRLSSRQITLLLSSIWAQSLSPENTPHNYEAIAHSYCLVLLFSRAKNSKYDVLARSFQLAFSLRNISLTEEGHLPPSRRRSLFTLANSMLLFSSKAYNILPLVFRVKAVLSGKTVDPFLCLVDDQKLKAVNGGAEQATNIAYGSKEDDNVALKTLAQIQITEDQSKESLASEILKSLGELSESDSSNLRSQLLNDFVPDDACPLGAEFMEAAQRTDKGDDSDSIASFEDDVLPESFEIQTKQNSELALATPNFLSVNQLLESVLETTHDQFETTSISSEANMPYKEMASHCEALLMGKQQKMSRFLSAHLRQDSLINVLVYTPEESHKTGDAAGKQAGSLSVMCVSESQLHPHVFQLPASSPYDNFLKAAGC